jgi:hypothetical protein
LGNANVTPTKRLALDVAQEQRALAVALFHQVNVPKVALYDGLPAQNLCFSVVFFITFDVCVCMHVYSCVCVCVCVCVRSVSSGAQTDTLMLE